MVIKKLTQRFLINTLLVVLALMASLFLMFVSILGPKFWPIAVATTSNPEGQYWLKGLFQAVPNLLTTAFIWLLFVKFERLPAWLSLLIFLPAVGIWLSVATAPNISGTTILEKYVSTSVVLLSLVWIFVRRFRSMKSKSV